MHFDDKHDWNPDDGTSQHQPSEDHRPRWVVIATVSHRLPLVKAEAQDKLWGKKNIRNNLTISPLTPVHISAMGLFIQQHLCH